MPPIDEKEALDTGAASLTRGRSYLRYGRLDDGIVELSQAQALLPGHLEASHELALAYRDRWSQRGHPKDREASIRFARYCLALDPAYGPAIALLNDLDHHAPVLLSRIASGLALLALAGAGVALLASLANDLRLT
jgi:hypothetical protein